MKSLFFSCLALLGVAGSSTLVHSADLLGGRDILRQLGDDSVESVDDPLSSEERRRALAAMEPEEAAEQWVAWVDEYLGGGSGEAPVFGEEGFARYLTILPSPASWPVIQDLVSNGTVERDPLHQLHLELLTALLIGDGERQWSKLLELEASVLANQGDGQTERLGLSRRGQHQQEARLRTLGQLMGTFLVRSDEPDQVRELLQRMVRHPSANSWNRGEVQVPDLVTLLGEEEARELLEDLFRESARTLRFDPSRDIREMAREVAVELAESGDLKALPSLEPRGRG